jgi:hypothetical protein
MSGCGRSTGKRARDRETLQCRVCGYGPKCHSNGNLAAWMGGFEAVHPDHVAWHTSRTLQALLGKVWLQCDRDLSLLAGEATASFVGFGEGQNCHKVVWELEGKGCGACRTDHCISIPRWLDRKGGSGTSWCSGPAVLDTRSPMDIKRRGSYDREPTSPPTASLPDPPGCLACSAGLARDQLSAYSSLESNRNPSLDTGALRTRPRRARPHTAGWEAVVLQAA